MLSDLMNQMLIVKLVSYGRLFPPISEWETVFLGPMASRDGRGNCNTTVWPLCKFCVNDQCTSWGVWIVFWTPVTIFGRDSSAEQMLSHKLTLAS